VGKLQTGRFERLAARTYSIKGPGALVDLDETVLGVLQLERQAGMEAHLMQEWETFGVRDELASAGSDLCWFLLSNPVGSGRLIVLDGWQRGTNAALSTKIFISRGVPPGFVSGPLAAGLDTRMATSRESAGRIFHRHVNITSFGTLIGEQLTAEFQRFQVVLAPDGSILWTPGVVAQAMSISVRWAERDAAPFELQ